MLVFILIRKFANRFQVSPRISHRFFGIIVTLFQLVLILVHFLVECLELQSDTELEEEFDHVSLPNFNKTRFMRQKCSLLGSHTFYTGGLKMVLVLNILL